MDPAHVQSGFQLRFEWGSAGAAALAPAADVAVVVDVLSFTTTVTVAVERGAAVWPCRWAAADADELARSLDAVRAVGRSQAQPGQISLSPASVVEAPDLTRLVLPSPNGSAIAAELADAGVAVVAGSLRNASAVGRFVAAGWPRGTVALIAAGEQWPGGHLRPALEDLWGAGAVARHLLQRGWGREASVEALAAAEAFQSVGSRLPQALAGCASGRELLDRGYAADVDLAAELDVSQAVPELHAGAFTRSRATSGAALRERSGFEEVDAHRGQHAEQHAPQDDRDDLPEDHGPLRRTERDQGR